MSDASASGAPFAGVIVIHNSARYLPGLFGSLKRHFDPAPELIVVDTGSTDDGAQIARENDATVIDRPDNPGFGTANNVAIEHVANEVCVLLNPDIEVLDAGLLDLVGLARQRRALLVPRLLNADGSIQRSAHPAAGYARSAPVSPRPPASLAKVSAPPRGPLARRRATAGRLGVGRLPRRSDSGDARAWSVRRGHLPVL